MIKPIMATPKSDKKNTNKIIGELSHAEAAMARKDWPEAIKRWRAILTKFGDKAPA